jgi:hypothetical protein
MLVLQCLVCVMYCDGCEGSLMVGPLKEIRESLGLVSYRSVRDKEQDCKIVREAFSLLSRNVRSFIFCVALTCVCFSPSESEPIYLDLLLYKVTAVL